MWLSTLLALLVCITPACSFSSTAFTRTTCNRHLPAVLFSTPPSADNDSGDKQDSSFPPPPPQDAGAATPAPVYTPAQQNAQLEQRKLDPLVKSVTRMDEATRNAPTMQVPLWGELILDKSLFVLLPVAAFAVLGLLTSIYVAINSGDQFVQALSETTSVQPPAAATTPTDPNVCRGLCSSQEQDLEGLAVFMNSLRK